MLLAGTRQKNKRAPPRQIAGPYIRTIFLPHPVRGLVVLDLQFLLSGLPPVSLVTFGMFFSYSGICPLGLNEISF